MANIQQVMLGGDPSIETWKESPAKFHLTLMVLELNDQQLRCALCNLILICIMLYLIYKVFKYYVVLCGMHVCGHQINCEMSSHNLVLCSFDDSTFPPVLFTLYSEAKKALDESVKVVSALLSRPYKLDKLSTFGQKVVYVTISDEETVAAFKEAAGRFIGLDW